MPCISFLIKHTLPSLLLEKATRQIVQKVLESSKYCSQGKHGMLSKAVQPQKKSSLPGSSVVKSSCLFLPSLNLARASCSLWGDGEVGRGQSTCGIPAGLGAGRKGEGPHPSVLPPHPCGSCRGLSWVLPLPGLESAGRIYLLFSGALPRGCRGLTQCHCAAHS